jgi:hypothetical protein
MALSYIKYGTLLAALTLSTAAFAQSGYWAPGAPGWGGDRYYSDSDYGPSYGPPERPYYAQPAYGWRDQPQYGPGYAPAYGWNSEPVYRHDYRVYNGSPYNGDGETGEYLMQSGE